MIEDTINDDLDYPLRRQRNMGSTGACLLIPRPPRGSHPPTGRDNVSVHIFVVLPAWNGKVWPANVVEVSNHTCWPSVVWAGNMTEKCLLTWLLTVLKALTILTTHKTKCNFPDLQILKLVLDLAIKE